MWYSSYLLYIAGTAEKNGSRINEFAKSLDGHFRKKTEDTGQTLGYEWYEEGWPQVYSEDLLPQPPDFENPTPYYFQDEYSENLLTAEYKSTVTASEKKNFLKRILKTGISVPLAIADEAFNDKDSAVRIYAASHLKFYPYSIKDFATALLDDADPVVRAALFSNPEYERIWQHWGPNDGWQEQIAGMSQLERLGAMRNPRLNAKFVVALMNEQPEKLNMSNQEHVALICAAAINPRLIEGSRRTGRWFWGSRGDWNPPFEDYGQMWRAAIEHWLDTAVPYRILKYVQTTREVKLETYKRLLKQEYSDLRCAVLESCEPREDGPILKHRMERSRRRV